MPELKIKIVKKLNSPINKVWDAWTDPVSVGQWLAPEGMSTPNVNIDLRVGGKYRITMEGYEMANPEHNGKVTVGGEYIEIDKPYKLVFTWLWEGSPKETHTTVVSVRLTTIDENKTEMVLTHDSFVDEHMRDEHNMGWNSTFNKLAILLKEVK